jgi:hypothetical protein
VTIARTKEIGMSKTALVLSLAAVLLPTGIAPTEAAGRVELTDAQMKELVRRSCQNVAMFNVNNKFALDPDNPQTSGGYNRVFADSDLVDHTQRSTSRPNKEFDDENVTGTGALRDNAHPGACTRRRYHPGQSRSC